MVIVESQKIYFGSNNKRNCWCFLYMYPYYYSQQAVVIQISDIYLVFPVNGSSFLIFFDRPFDRPNWRAGNTVILQYRYPSDPSALLSTISLSTTVSFNNWSCVCLVFQLITYDLLLACQHATQVLLLQYIHYAIYCNIAIILGCGTGLIHGHPYRYRRSSTNSSTLDCNTHTVYVHVYHVYSSMVICQSVQSFSHGIHTGTRVLSNTIVLEQILLACYLVIVMHDGILKNTIALAFIPGRRWHWHSFKAYCNIVI